MPAVARIDTRLSCPCDGCWTRRQAGGHSIHRGAIRTVVEYRHATPMEVRQTPNFDAHEITTNFTWTWADGRVESTSGAVATFASIETQTFDGGPNRSPYSIVPVLR
jgi:hypothetical protein